MKITNYILVTLLICVGNAWGAERVAPLSDLTYAGSFLPPSQSHYQYALDGLGYDQSTDTLIAGVNMTGGIPKKVEILTIPATSSSWVSDIVTLPKATLVTSNFDLTVGKQYTDEYSATHTFSDALYLPQQTGQDEGKYYWMTKVSYDVGTDTKGSLGWTNSAFSSSRGSWKLDGDMAVSGLWGSYLLEINNTWASTHVGGKILGMGKAAPNKSYGPSLVVTAPWIDDAEETLVDQSVIAHTTLMNYPSTNPMDAWGTGVYHHGIDGAWVTIGSKQAFVVMWTGSYSGIGGKWWKSNKQDTTNPYHERCGNITSTQARLTGSISDSATNIPVTDGSAYPPSGHITIYSNATGEEYIGYSSVSGNNLVVSQRGMFGSTPAAHNTGDIAWLNIRDYWDYSRGFWTSGYDSIVRTPMLMFFDVDQLAEVAAGTRQPYDIVPYSILNLDNFFYTPPSKGEYHGNAHTSGMAYDKNNNRLILSEYLLGGQYNGGQVFHIINLADGEGSIDSTPPAAPASVTVDGSGVVSWSGVTDDSGADVTYVVFKYYTNLCYPTGNSEYRPVKMNLGTSWTDPAYQSGDIYAVRTLDRSMNQSGYAYSELAETPTCSDAMQNGDETGIDCGGSCSACQSSGAGFGAGSGRFATGGGRLSW